MTLLVLDERLSNSDQSLHGTRIAETRSYKYRARIRRNAYDNQCSAVVEVWLPERGWSELQHVPIEDLSVFACSYGMHDPAKWQPQMRSSLGKLCELGVAILEGDK